MTQALSDSAAVLIGEGRSGYREGYDHSSADDLIKTSNSAEANCVRKNSAASWVLGR